MTTALLTNHSRDGRVLRARQLTKLLLNAPLLSLSRLHVTALMSQAHVVDGMINYVELVRNRAQSHDSLAVFILYTTTLFLHAPLPFQK